MSDRPECDQDVPDSTQNAEPTQNPESANRSYYAHSGSLCKAETIQQNVTMNSSSDGTWTPKKIQAEIARDAQYVYANDGAVLEAKTITGSLIITHTHGARRPQ